jgi:hypothetical protein
MKNHFLKKIFIAGFSVLFFISCSDSTPHTVIDPDTHPQIDFNFNTETAYKQKEFQLIDPEKIEIDSLYIQVGYQLSPNRILLIARKNEAIQEGLKMLLIDPTQSNKLLFRSRGVYDSMIMHPTFFIPEKDDNAWIILTALGFTESWGQNLFFLKGDTINEISYLDIASKEESDYKEDESGLRLMDIAPFTSIYKNEKGFTFTFTCDSIYYYGDIGTQNNPILKGSSFSYVFKEKLNIEIQL